jgi:hypothetical protein
LGRPLGRSKKWSSSLTTVADPNGDMGLNIGIPVGDNLTVLFLVGGSRIGGTQRLLFLAINEVMRN